VFSMSNVLVTYLILEYTGIKATDKAMSKVLGDVTKVTRWFGHFLRCCLVLFTQKHIGFKSTNVIIPEPGNIEEVVLPYFIRGERK
jgi:hypothetical protein